MKFLLLSFACFLCGLPLARAEESNGTRLMVERLIEVWKEFEGLKRNCTDETDGVTAEDVDFGSNGCLLACVMKKASIMNGKKFSREVADKKASYILEEVPELMSMVHGVHLACEEELAAMKLTDECEIALKLHMCVDKGWKQAGFKHWSPK